MIYLDEQGYPVDRTYDGGDSAVRNGMLLLVGHPSAKPMTDYVHSGGMLTRHPHQAPWNNPYNFSRDQLMACVPGMDRATARKVLYSCLLRMCFAQNIQRDWPGSWKFPWPHMVDGEQRNFDFADPLMPNHMGALIIAARLYVLYPLLPLASLAHVIAIVAHSKSGHYEEAQMMAECYMYNTLPLYRKIHARWRQISWGYWNKRGEGEYHTMLERLVDRA